MAQRLLNSPDISDLEEQRPSLVGADRKIVRVRKRESELISIYIFGESGSRARESVLVYIYLISFYLYTAM